MDFHWAVAAVFAMGPGLSPIHAAIPDAVHPDFELREIPMPDRYKVMGLAFLKDGRMVMATTESIGGGEAPSPNTDSKVYLVSGMEGDDSAKIRLKTVAGQWRQIAGITVAEEKVYVSDRDGHYEILDLENPGNLAANRRLIVKWPDEGTWNNGFMWHQWVFTPIYRQGSFYAPFSGSIMAGGPSWANPTSKLSGAFLKWDLTGKLEAWAGGLRSPNGANIDAEGEMFVTDNQGSWLPSSTFMRMKPGRFYGHRQSPELYDSAGKWVAGFTANFAEGLPYERPVAWLPHGTVRSSPSQPACIPKGRFAGQWLVGDVNNPGLLRIALDRVDSACNGAVFWFSRGMASAAINRLAWGPEGSLYIGTITRIGGNWPGGDKAPLFRLSPKPVPQAFEMLAIRSLRDGVEIEFTDKVGADGMAPDSFAVMQWQYVRQAGYGQGRQPDEPRSVSAVEISRDGKRLHLRIAGLREDRVTYFKLGGLKSAAGRPLWDNEAWFTLNAVADRSWNSAASLRGDPPRREAWVALRTGGLGILYVTVDRAGPCLLSLRTADGSLAEEAWVRGGAVHRLARPSAGPGLFLLQVRSGREVFSRKIIFP